jgi:hypothetical protein
VRKFCDVQSDILSPSRKKIRHCDDSDEVSDDDDITSGLLNMSVDDGDMSPCDQQAPMTSDETDDETLSRLLSILPSVISSLKEAGHIDMFVKFGELVASNRLPLDNIAFLLFNDVVHWYTLDSTSQMRYNDVVKRFWRTGHKLFKGKFLRFMSGMKSTGSLNEGVSERGMYDPQQSEINFTVPSRSVLEKIPNPICEGKLRPGIISTMMDSSRASRTSSSSSSMDESPTRGSSTSSISATNNIV